MFQPFICGAFSHQEEDDHELSSTSSPNSTPRKSRRNSFCKSKSKSKSQDKDDKKNPYSSRGLDKFSALLAELEEKRQKIYSQTGSQDISFVRFMYKNSTDCVPIVVKLKDKKEEVKKQSVEHTIKLDHHPAGLDADSEVLDKQPIETVTEGNEVNKKLSELQSFSEKTEKKKKKTKNSFSWRNMEFHKWRQPSYYLPSFLLLILLLLVFFGKSVSILFTCIGWYMVPIIPGESSNRMTTSMKKRDYARKSSQIRDHHRQS